MDEKADSLKYLDYIRKIPCIITGQPAEPHHLRAIGSSGERKKPSRRHYTAVPLSRDIHIAAHVLTSSKFKERYSINLWAEAHRLFTNYVLEYHINEKL